MIMLNESACFPCHAINRKIMKCIQLCSILKNVSQDI